jgi:DNA repair protein RadC
LNARNEVVFKKHLFVGTLDANICHPREIFKKQNFSLKEKRINLKFFSLKSGS